ncbi:MAG: hypothetical protein IK072_03170 [Clostridia bacterium]|nr:hypothetical protein [Clostridia bacterium]
MYRRYYSYNDMPQMIVHNEEERKKPEKKQEQKKEECKPCQNNKIFGNFELDDIILGIVILALLIDDGDDSVLLLALAVIFLTGMN